MKPIVVDLDEQDDIWLSAVQVRALFGEISQMTLHRWLLNRGFPRPAKISGRNFFSWRAVLAWRILDGRGGRERTSRKIDMLDETDSKHPPSEIANIKELRNIFNTIAYNNGVYFLCQQERVVYVGRSHNVVSRAATHVGCFDFDCGVHYNFEPEVARQRLALEQLEGTFIRFLRPRLNGLVTHLHARGDPTKDAELLKLVMRG